MSHESNAETGSADLRDKAAKVTEELREIGGHVRDAAREKYENLSEEARAYYEHGKEKAHEWEEGLESYVREKPLRAVLIAAGVGLLLGVLWKRS
jgi:ElaB/YqjD/DUF883 family membrane-anchored ribosome-binding protein